MRARVCVRAIPWAVTMYSIWRRAHACVHVLLHAYHAARRLRASANTTQRLCVAPTVAERRLCHSAVWLSFSKACGTDASSVQLVNSLCYTALFSMWDPGLHRCLRACLRVCVRARVCACVPACVQGGGLTSAIFHTFSHLSQFSAIFPQMLFACPPCVLVGALCVPCVEVLLLEAPSTLHPVTASTVNAMDHGQTNIHPATALPNSITQPHTHTHTHTHTPGGRGNPRTGGAAGWDRRGCATGAPGSATRQGEEQHRHTERGSHTRRDKGEQSRQGGGAQQGRRGNQNSGNREPEWSGWWSVRMGGSDNKGDGLASQPRCYRVPGQPLLNRHQVGGVYRSPDGLFAQQEREPIRGRPAVRGKGTYGERSGQRVEEQGTWASRTETQRGRLWTACGQRCVDSKNSQTTPATTSTSSIRQLLGAADTQTAHHATFSTAPTHQLLGSANAETTPARAPAAAADRK